MYKEHYGLQELPFGITPDTQFFFAHNSYQEALNTLLIAARSGEGFLKVVGEVGTGKTLLCRKFLNQLDTENFITAIPCQQHTYPILVGQFCAIVSRYGGCVAKRFVIGLCDQGNSIDYILKPVDKDELGAALKKLKNLTGSEHDTRQLLDNIEQTVQMLMKKYKTRFVIKVGEHLRTIDVNAVKYFFSQEKTTFCVTDDNRNFILDYTLEQLEEMIDPALYFRINRKYLVSSGAILDIISYTNSRLKLVLKGSQDNDIIVARERVQDFKTWLDR